MSLVHDPLLGPAVGPTPASKGLANGANGTAGGNGAPGPLLLPPSPTPSPDRDEESLDVWRVYAIFIKWLWLIATVTAVAFTAVAFYTFRQVRIYRADELRHKIAGRGMRFIHSAHAHALHSPYWWLKCLAGVDNDKHWAVTSYHRMLVWDMMKRPWLTRTAESALDPLIGKSVALYFTKPAVRRGGC